MTMQMTLVAHDRKLPLTIGVMAKAPVAGYAKTRLAPLLGADAAAALHKEMVVRTLMTVNTLGRGIVSIFSAGALDHPFWSRCERAFEVPIVPQRGDDLGQRMQNALGTLLERADKALLIGTDCMVLRANHVRAAATALDHARMVFIPAEDGGYVLVGGRESEESAFRDIRWSQPNVMADTRTALQAAGWRAGHDWVELPPLWDIDTPEDYERAVGLKLVATTMARN